MSNDNEYKVSSELYDEFDYKTASTSSKPIVDENNTISQFKFSLPPPSPIADSDGDLIIERRRTTNQNHRNEIIEIEHSKSTVLELVGLQIWRGALLLADWLIYKFNDDNKNDENSNYILELGAGVGLTSIVAAKYAPVYCTDVNKGDLLKLIRANIDRNQKLTSFEVKVTELDFTAGALPPEIDAILDRTRIVIAADVVYDDYLTESFVNTVALILSKPGKRAVYVALEKRYVFTINDCDSIAPCYEFFLECMRDKFGKMRENITFDLVPIDFPQYFQYDRCKELVLWRIAN